MADNDSYVLINLRHDFDLVYEDADGNYVPLSPQKLPARAYIYRGMIGEIHFPKTTEIGSECFKMCSSLKLAEIPLVERIGDGAFQGCSLLEWVDLDKRLSYIGNSAFQGCSSLSSIDATNLLKIGYNAFEDCTSLESMDLPRTTEIGDNCFRGCANLESINLPNAMKVGRAAFHGCQKIETVFMPKAKTIETATSNQSITDGVFQGCFSLKTIILPQITRIGKNAFSRCLETETISIPKVPTTGLSSGMFSDCSNLKWLNISSTVPLGNMEQYREELGIPDGCCVTCLGGDMSLPEKKTDPSEFKLDGEDGRENLLTYVEEPLETTEETPEDSEVPQICYISGVASGATLPETLFECCAQGIKEQAFKDRTELTTVILPNATYKIEYEAFSGCENLVHVSLPRKRLDDGNNFKIEDDAFENCPNVKYLELSGATMSQVNSRMGENAWGLKDNKDCLIVCKDGVITL